VVREGSFDPRLVPSRLWWWFLDLPPSPLTFFFFLDLLLLP